VGYVTQLWQIPGNGHDARIVPGSIFAPRKDPTVS
jgi:hypothetical protein